jgi:hypothetical protein
MKTRIGSLVSMAIVKELKRSEQVRERETRLKFMGKYREGVERKWFTEKILLRPTQVKNWLRDPPDSVRS